MIWLKSYTFYKTKHTLGQIKFEQQNIVETLSYLAPKLYTSFQDDYKNLSSHEEFKVKNLGYHENILVFKRIYQVHLSSRLHLNPCTDNLGFATCFYHHYRKLSAEAVGKLQFSAVKQIKNKLCTVNKCYLKIAVFSQNYFPGLKVH